MNAGEIREVIDQVSNNDLRNVPAALAATGARVKKAQEELRNAIKHREAPITETKYLGNNNEPTLLSPAGITAVGRWGKAKTSVSNRQTYQINNKPDPLVAINRRQLLKEKAIKLANSRALACFKDELEEAYERCSYRKSQSNWAGGEHELKISIGSPSADGRSERAWSKNGKWSGTNSVHSLRIPRDWNKVITKGIATVDGLLTLDYQLTDNPRIISAVWVEQSVGFTITEKKGFLVEVAPEIYTHADTLVGAKKKLNQPVSVSSLRVEGLTAVEMLGRARLMGDEMITLDTARAAGHCDAGIRDWLAKRGIGVKRGVITARELAEVAISSGDRVRFVYAVLLMAGREVRKAA